MNNPKNVLITIDSYLRNIPLQQKEKERMRRDLEVVLLRLQKGEYRITDYSEKNKFNVPERTKEFFSYMESYCLTGKTIARLLSCIPLHTYDTVVDFCSGWAPKVALAFFYQQYEGKVVIMDKNRSNLLQLKKFMSLFHPRYNIVPYVADIWNYQTMLSYPLVIANHVLDDLLLEFFAKKEKVNIQSLYDDEQLLVSLWNTIIKNKKNIVSKYLGFLQKVFSHLVRKKGILILSQYQSMIEHLLSLDQVTIFNKHIMKLLITQMKRTGKWKILEDIPHKALHTYKGAFSAEECFVLQRIK
jgi:hypothetical protein